MGIKQQSSYYLRLKNKWIARHKKLQRRLNKKHKQALSWFHNNPAQIALGGLGSLMLLSTPSIQSLPATTQVVEAKVQDKKANLIEDLGKVVPDKARVLSDDEEKVITDLLSIYTGYNILPEIDGKKLNRSYGLIGAEQHLMRYPGDNIYTHFDSQEAAVKFGSSGMAPGRGAWGYFAKSRSEMTERDKMREKYYLAVQTFLVPDYNQRVSEYRDFFKFRKMLIVNNENGKMMVVVIGDAGPASWTGKHLGGSPEVMNYLERKDGAQKGPVLYFFINDPEDNIPLGPVSL